VKLHFAVAAFGALLQGTTSAKFKAGRPTVPVDIDWQAANQGRLAKALDAIMRPS